MVYDDSPMLDWNVPPPPLVAELYDDMTPYERLALALVKQVCADFNRSEGAKGLTSLEEWLRSEHASVCLDILGIEGAVRERVIETILAKALRGEVGQLLAQVDRTREDVSDDDWPTEA